MHKLPLLFLMVATGAASTHAAVSTSIETVTGTVAVDGSATDFIVFNSDNYITKDGGGSLFSASADGAIFQGGNGAYDAITWTNGTPIASGSTNTSAYVGFGSGFAADQSSYFELDVTLPTGNANVNIWLLPNSNGGTLTYEFSMGTGTDSYQSSTISDPDSSDMTLYSFELTGFAPGETATFRFDNVSGSNNWHNVGLLAAEINSTAAVPEPSTYAFAAGIAALLGLCVVRRKR
ncbi:MAG: hypothetical protein E1N59_1442 [Puniceicoccaceae bacterium 5H]|nr:MAG: hypothetical protein E1N59_1442 [Puniceicoccaceae bacterium 5H]